VTPAESGGALAEAVRLICDDPVRRRRMGEAGRAYARANWDRARTLEDMEQALLKIGGAHAG
jgi:hypothetical protein